MNMLKRLSIIYDRILDYTGASAVVLLAFAWLLVTIDVLLRATVSRSITWTMEVVGYTLVYMTLLSAAWVLRRERHISVDMVLHRFNPAPRAVVNIVISVLGAITWLIIAWYSGHFTWDNFQMGSTFADQAIVKPPMWTILVILPFGSLLLFIQFARRTFGYLRDLRTLSSKQQGHGDNQ